MINKKLPQRIPQDLQDFLAKIKQTLPKILNKNLVGIYIYGSLSYGSWGVNRSDVDLAVLTENDLSKTDLTKLKKWYQDYKLVASRWHYRSEIIFISQKKLKNITKPNLQASKIVGSKLKIKAILYGFPLELRNLREDGINLLGPSAKKVFPKVSKDLLKKSIIANFKDLNKTSFAWVKIDIWNQQYVVSQYCRMLSALENDYQVISKKDAVKWALRNTPEKYSKMLKLTLENMEDFTGPKQTIITKNLPSFVKYIESKIE